MEYLVTEDVFNLAVVVAEDVDLPIASVINTVNRRKTEAKLEPSPHLQASLNEGLGGRKYIRACESQNITTTDTA